MAALDNFSGTYQQLIKLLSATLNAVPTSDVLAFAAQEIKNGATYENVLNLVFNHAITPYNGYKAGGNTAHTFVSTLVNNATAGLDISDAAKAEWIEALKLEYANHKSNPSATDAGFAVWLLSVAETAQFPEGSDLARLQDHLFARFEAAAVQVEANPASLFDPAKGWGQFNPDAFEGKVFDIIPGEAAGADVARLTGDQTVRIDLTNPANQVTGLDLNGDGVIANDGKENNVKGVASDYEIFDAYARNPIDETDRVNNFLGNIYFDGTGFDGDGVKTDGNIFLGGLGADTAFGGIGNDFLAGGGIASTRGGEDKLYGGRNADFFFVELSTLTNTDGNRTFIDGGNTADDTAGGATASSQDADWLLLEVSDDEEPVTVRLESSLDDENGDGNYDNDGYITTRSGNVSQIRDVENVDASGNLYGFLDDLDVEIGGRRLLETGEGSQNYGIGSSAQLNIIGSSEKNIIVGGYDNDNISGGAGNDILLGGNLQFLLETVLGGTTNPNLRNIKNDGIDHISGGAGNDAILLELDRGSVDGGEGHDTVYLTNYSVGRPAATEAESIAAVLTDGKIRLDLGYANYRGYRGDSLGEGDGVTTHLDEPNSTSTSDHVAGTADQSNYNTGYGSTKVTGIESVIATGLGQIDYLAAGTNDPELNFRNQQNFFATTADLELRGTDNRSYSTIINLAALAEVEGGPEFLQQVGSYYNIYKLATSVFGGTPLSQAEFTESLLGIIASFGDGEIPTSTVVSFEAGNVLYASSGDDLIEGRQGDDFLSGGAGNDDFVFRLSNKQSAVETDTEEVFVRSEDYENHEIQWNSEVGAYGYYEEREVTSFDADVDGDGVDTIHRQADRNGDNIWDGDYVRDFGLDETSTVGASVLRIAIEKVGGNDPSDELADVVNYVSEITTGVKLADGSWQVVTLNTQEIRSASTYQELVDAINAGLEAQGLAGEVTAELQSDGVTIYITDSLGRELADTIAEVPGAGVTVNQKANTQTANVFEYGEPEVSISQDRLIFKAYEDRGRNEGVDDDSYEGSSISLGKDAYAEDLTVGFVKDANGVVSTHLAEDQRYDITFADLTTEDVVTVSVNGVEYKLQVGKDLDGNLIGAENASGGNQAAVQAAFLARFTEYINSFLDDDTAAGQLAAALTGNTISIIQRDYDNEEVVFINKPTVQIANRSGGIAPTYLVENKSSGEVVLFEFDGRDGALNRDNVLFVGEEFINRSVLETAKAEGGVLNGSEALVIDGRANTLAAAVEGTERTVYDNQATDINGDFAVHGDDLLIGGNGNDIINAGTGDDRVIGSLGQDVLDGGKEYYAVKFLDEAQARVFVLNTWEAQNPTQVAAIQALITSGKVLSSVAAIQQTEDGIGLEGGSSVTDPVFRDTLVYQQADFGQGKEARFTITLDGFTGTGDDIEWREGGAGHVGVDADGDGAVESGNVSQFKNFENIRTVSGWGKADASQGQGRDTLDLSALSTASGGVYYDLTNGSNGGNVHYSTDEVVTGADQGTAAGDRPDDGDYLTLAIKVDGVENVIGGLGDDLLRIDETEAAKDNVFDGGLGIDRIEYRYNFDGDNNGVAQPTITIKVGAVGSNTDTVESTGGRVGTTKAIDTLIGVEYIGLYSDTAEGALENDQLDVSALSGGAVVDYTNGEVRTSEGVGSNVQVVIENLEEVEIVKGSAGNDRVIVADASVHEQNSRNDDSDGTDAKPIGFLTWLDFDDAVGSTSARQAFGADPSDITLYHNQNQFTFDLGAGSNDIVDYSQADDSISVVVNLAATNDRYVLVDGSYWSGNVWSDSQGHGDRIDHLIGVESIVASNTEAGNDSILDLTGATTDVTIEFRSTATNVSAFDRDVYSVLVSDTASAVPLNSGTFLEYRDAGASSSITQNAATWNRIEGGDKGETVKVSAQHLNDDDTYNLRGGDNHVLYNDPLGTGIELTLSLFNYDDTQSISNTNGVIRGDVEFRNNVGTTGGPGAPQGSAVITSYTANNGTAAGSLTVTASVGQFDSFGFTGLLNTTAKTITLDGTGSNTSITVDVTTDEGDNEIVLNGFEQLQDSAADDAYDFTNLTNVATFLDLIDNANADHDAILLHGTDGFNLGAVGATTISLAELNTAFTYNDGVNPPVVFDFDVLDVSGSSSALTEVIGAGGVDDELVIGAVGNLATITDFDSVVLTDATLAAGNTFVLDLTAGELQQGATTVAYDGTALSAGGLLWNTGTQESYVAPVAGAVNVTVVDTAAVGATVWGGDGNDVITGASGDDVIKGGKGADVLDGGFSPEQLAVVSFAFDAGTFDDNGNNAIIWFGSNAGSGVKLYLNSDGAVYLADFADAGFDGLPTGSPLATPVIAASGAPGALNGANSDALGAILSSVPASDWTLAFAGANAGAGATVQSVSYDAAGIGGELSITFASGEEAATLSDYAVDAWGTGTINLVPVAAGGGIPGALAAAHVERQDSVDTFVYESAEESTATAFDSILNFNIDQVNGVNPAVNDILDFSAITFAGGSTFAKGDAANFANLQTAANSSFAVGTDVYVGSDGTDAYVFGDTNADGTADLVIKLVGITDTTGFDNGTNLVL